MIAAVFKGPNEIEIQEIATPRIGPGEVLVKMGANTVSGYIARDVAARDVPEDEIRLGR
jgi:NADPH:quinone reductase-like Zn-dependent oxidoreductase